DGSTRAIQGRVDAIREPHPRLAEVRADAAVPPSSRAKDSAEAGRAGRNRQNDLRIASAAGSRERGLPRRILSLQPRKPHLPAAQLPPGVPRRVMQRSYYQQLPLLPLGPEATRGARANQPFKGTIRCIRRFPG